MKTLKSTFPSAMLAPLRSGRLLPLAAALCSLLCATGTSAQSYPSKPIRLIHGFASGSAIDVFSRPLAQRLTAELGQQVVVDIRPGATGTIANDLVAKSAPDGYTLLAAPGSAMAATPHLFKGILAIFLKPISKYNQFQHFKSKHNLINCKLSYLKNC